MVERNDAQEYVDQDASPYGQGDAEDEQGKPGVLEKVRNWRSIIDFAYTSPETAQAMADIIPQVLKVAAVLLVLSFAANFLLAGGFIWGVLAALSVVMTGFFWLCSSNALKLHHVPEETRSKLRRGIRLLVGAFFLSIIAVGYFLMLGMESLQGA